MWRGEGEGHYPTITDFQYGEELTFAHPNPAKVRQQQRGGDSCWNPPLTQRVRAQPVVAYSHKTWRAADKTPMHSESGFLRVKPDGTAEFACAQATCLAEASSGEWDAATRTLTLASTSVGNAAKVLAIARNYTLSEDGETLRYSIAMRTHEQPLQEHLRATLKRVS